MIAPARQAGVTAAQIREVVYQATAYLGIGRGTAFCGSSRPGTGPV